MKVSAVAVRDRGARLLVKYFDSSESIYSARWLRLSAPDEATTDPHSEQRLVDLQHGRRTVLVDARLEGGHVLLTYEPAQTCTISGDFFWPKSERPALPPKITWGAELGQVPEFDWEEVRERDSADQARWLYTVVQTGVAILRNVPVQANYLSEIVGVFGRIRPNRTGLIFDVEMTSQPSNLAFTAKGLSLHTDNPYRNPVPGLQLLHCLRSALCGGESIVADGFYAAQILLEESPRDFELLTRIPVTFRYRSEDVWFEHSAPVIELDINQHVAQIRFNNRSLNLPIMSPVDADAFCAALAHFDEILARDNVSMKFKMMAGDVFLCDNRRILHGRTEFATSDRRLLQGAYVDADWLESRVRLNIARGYQRSRIK